MEILIKDSISYVPLTSNGLKTEIYRRSKKTLFDPSKLFHSGADGVWYDPSDLTTLFQDHLGTIPATFGQPVGLMLDKSGRGNHASQPTVAARPTLMQDVDGRAYLDFDGVDDVMNFASRFNLLDKHLMHVVGGDTTENGSAYYGDAVSDSDIFVSANTDNYRLAFRAAGINHTGTLIPKTTGPILGELVVEPTRLVHYLDGRHNSYNNGFTAELAATAYLSRIGQGIHNARDIDGAFYSLLVFDRMADADTIDLLLKYQSEKYGKTWVR